ncbi:hypothetical protein [Phascolarctobacterium faecium]|jgi:hypothetical protein|uniref:hypothetical protein n=1 Tax=Phascolarctobacterium faecium TaxID=33025 RepID=UPI00242DC5FF|nr:hypothetical protein [Phascolarctobacterium faecium]HJI09864.1 hypothetical protein [Phascolarctobacterium faecium]
MSIISRKTLNIINKKYRQRNSIEQAVWRTKLERLDRGSYTGNIGYSQPDPTGNAAIRNAEEVLKVEITNEHGFIVTIDYPERWLKVMDTMIYHYQQNDDDRHQKTQEIIMRRYFKGESPDVTAGLLGIGRTTYFELLDKFLADTAAVAFHEGVLELPIKLIDFKYEK